MADILGKLDPAFTDRSKRARLADLLQRQLVKDYEAGFEHLIVKEAFYSKFVLAKQERNTEHFELLF